MEKLLMDIVNASIAVFKSGEERLKTALSDLEKLYDEMKVKGESDTSENAQKLRELLNKTIHDSKEAISKANATYEEALKSVQASYENLANQVDTMVPSEVKDAIQKSIDELKKLINKQS